MLAGAVVYDLRERRVPNPWWIPFAWLAGILALGDLLAPQRDWVLLGLQYGMAAIVAGACYAFWRLRLFGGADAKGLMVLALLAPVSPGGTLGLQPALDALANGALAMLLVPVGFLLANLLRGRLALPAALLGTPMRLERARATHVWPMQVVAGDGLRWRYWQRLGSDLELEYVALEKAGVQTVWVTPKVPFLVPVAAGWLATWIWGNLMLILVQRAGIVP